MNIQAVQSVQQFVAGQTMAIIRATLPDSPGGKKINWREKVSIFSGALIDAISSIPEWGTFLEEIKDIDPEEKAFLQRSFAEKFFGDSTNSGNAKRERFIESVWNQVLQFAETCSAGLDLFGIDGNSIDA